jgi:parvulin-like peptidyl-prolyl isomerase
VEAFWAAHRELFAVPELIRLSHILVRPGEDESDEEVIERCREIKIRLEEGADFAELAREISDGSSAVRGGDLGYFRREQVIPEFRSAAEELSVGEISDPIGTEYGYHLLLVSDFKPPREKTLEESREEAAALLLAEKRKTRFETVRDALAETASISKNRELIERLQADQNRALIPPPGAGTGAR